MSILQNIIENSYFQNITCGVVGGLIVLVLQKVSDKRTKEKEKIKNSIVGKKDLKILSQDFLYQYEPGKITIDKLIEGFGQPQRRYHSDEYDNYIFEFKNAKLEVINSKIYNSVVALTVYSKLDNKYPINCRISFEEDEKLGKAKISESILNNHFYFESYSNRLGHETILGCYNAYRQTKHLKYFYQISGKFDKIEDTKGEVIVQVCVTENEDKFSFFSFDDTFYG